MKFYIYKFLLKIKYKRSSTSYFVILNPIRTKSEEIIMGKLINAVKLYTF